VAILIGAVILIAVVAIAVVRHNQEEAAKDKLNAQTEAISSITPLLVQWGFESSNTVPLGDPSHYTFTDTKPPVATRVRIKLSDGSEGAVDLKVGEPQPVGCLRANGNFAAFPLQAATIKVVGCPEPKKG
jgi:hypothetical protein